MANKNLSLRSLLEKEKVNGINFLDCFRDLRIKQHEDMVVYEMIQNLKEIYEGQARQERYETSKALFFSHFFEVEERDIIETHVIKIMGYIQMLEKLGFPLKDELVTDNGYDFRIDPFYFEIEIFSHFLLHTPRLILKALFSSTPDLTVRFTSSKADIGGIKNEEVKLERLKTTADRVLQLSGERETVRTISGTELNVAVGVYEEIQMASDCKDV
ncbi:hypothetical protein GQ457_10G008790 [Hibiscus cannabinus]